MKIATLCLNLNLSQETVGGFTHAIYAPLSCSASTRKLATTGPKAHVTTNIYSNSQSVGMLCLLVTLLQLNISVPFMLLPEN